MPLGATMCAPAAACASAIRAYSGSVASLSTSPRSFSTPQCPWSVYSSRQRSVIITASSPKSSRSARIACCVIPSGFHASDALGVLVLGHPEQHEREHAARPDVGRLFAQRLDRVLGLAGHRRDRHRLGDALLHEQRRDQVGGRRAMVSRTSARSAGVRRRRRGRSTGKAIAQGSGPAGPPAQTRVITTTGIVRFDLLLVVAELRTTGRLAPRRGGRARGRPTGPRRGP